MSALPEVWKPSEIVCQSSGQCDARNEPSQGVKVTAYSFPGRSDCREPDCLRSALGVIPKFARNLRQKCELLAKPTSKATSISDLDVRSMRSMAFFMRIFSAYLRRLKCPYSCGRPARAGDGKVLHLLLSRRCRYARRILLHTNQCGLDTVVAMYRKWDWRTALDLTAFAPAVKLKDFEALFLRVLPYVPAHEKCSKVGTN